MPAGWPVGDAAAVAPRATYRLQLRAGFGFAAAGAMVPYLDALGVSHLYLSPVLKARPGSAHGYDVVDPRQLNPELGTREDFDRLVAALHARGMGLVLDIVPNHMGVFGADNPWWMDVLAHGRASPHAGFFDIDWLGGAQDHEADGAASGAAPCRLLLPLLPDHLGAVLERGQMRLTLEAETGAFVVWTGGHRLPLDPASVAPILRAVARTAHTAHTAEVAELTRVAEALSRLAPWTTGDARAAADRRRDAAIHQRAFSALLQDKPALLEAVQACVAELNGRPGEPASFDALEALLGVQPWRAAHWLAAADEINYRRFCDINDLAALRVQDDAVFEATHALIRSLVEEGAVDGLRVDHVDGLADPAAYLRRLSGWATPRRGASGLSARSAHDTGHGADHGADHGAAHDADHDADLGAPRGRVGRPYLVVEKVLAPAESLPPDWPVDGTTGYDFARLATGLCVDHGARDRLGRCWRAFVGDEPSPTLDETLRQARLAVMRERLAGELAGLAAALRRLARGDRHRCDLTHASLQRVLAEWVAQLPVYRTYLGAAASPAAVEPTSSAATKPVLNSPARMNRGLRSSSRTARELRTSPAMQLELKPSSSMVAGLKSVAGALAAPDGRVIEEALAGARRHVAAIDLPALDFLRDALRRVGTDAPCGPEDDAHRDFARRLQPFTAAVMAKGVEDMAWYRHLRLLALNEVGGDPGGFGVRIAEFHRANAARARRWPHAMLATSTHDTKRSEDVRARLAVLCEVPAAWRLATRRWRRLNAACRQRLGGTWAPSRHDEYLLYQTLVGTLPLAGQDVLAPPDPAWSAWRERIAAYLVKSAREARLHTDWAVPDADYEAALRAFVYRVLDGQSSRVFIDDLRTSLVGLARCGAWNALAVTAWKLTVPGVPDIYQGQEGWDVSLVDPDNRRLIDPADLARSLEALAQRHGPQGQGWGRDPLHGDAKRWLTWRLLVLRRREADLFRHGAYRPLSVRGPCATQAVAYLRRWRTGFVVVVTGRLFARLTGLGHSTEPAGRLIDAADWRGTVLRTDGLPLGLHLFDALGASPPRVVDETPWLLAELFTDAPVAVWHGTL